MKRAGNLYPQICSIPNLILADRLARRRKGGQRSLRAHDRRRGCNIITLHNTLMDGEYKTSPYTTFPVYEPKERTVYCLPFYPDRIAQYAILNVIETIFTDCFTADTYSCIKGRGIHGMQKKLQKALNDREGTRYCLKLDIRKFYPQVDHDILKALLLRKFKDKALLALLFEIIDSAEGLPIGNYLSQFFANFFLSCLDHWLKEVKKVKYYFRYADDLVLLSGDKAYLHQLLADIREYLKEELNLTLKDNYQVFPVAARGIDVIGYVFFHGYCLLRKSIKQRYCRKMAKQPNAQSISAYDGWLKHCKSKHLRKKVCTNLMTLILNKKVAA